MGGGNASDGVVYRGGLDQPVFGAQEVFRHVMDAMARPGTVQPLEVETGPPSPLTSGVGAIAATLFDHDTPVWLDPKLAREPSVGKWLAFQTGAPLTTETFAAHFAIVVHVDVLPSLEAFSQGTQEYPDRSTTLILQVDRLKGGEPLVLTGPGIRNSARIAPVGLPTHFREQWRGNRNRFPRGVDIILAAPEGIMGLPRTTTVRSEDELEDTACM